MLHVTPSFKDKAECTPYVSPGSQISHIATNEGAVSIHNAYYIAYLAKEITLESNQRIDNSDLRV